MSNDEQETPPAPGIITVGPGARLGPYLIREQLGEGGMATVFLAEDAELERTVAIKIMRSDLQARPGFAQRFIREARAAAKISHPHVVTIFGAGREMGLLYMAFEYLQGGDLQSRIDQQGAQDVDQTLSWLIQCTQGLIALHRAGVVHRDIKPRNIFLSLEGDAKLGDLGLVKGMVDDGLTMTGDLMGTPAYMSPEQARGETNTIDIRSDIYGLAATGYALLVGGPPVTGESGLAILQTIASDAPIPDIRSKRREIPQALALVLMRALAKDVRGRHQTPEALLADLEAVRSGQPTGLDSLAQGTTPALATTRISSRSAPTQTGNSTRRNRLLAAGIIAIVLLILGLMLLPDDEAPGDPQSPSAPAQSDTDVPDMPLSAPADGSWSLTRSDDRFGPVLAIVGPAEQRFRRIPADTFTIGSPGTETNRGDDEVRRQVAFSQRVWIADTEATRALWQAAMDTPGPQTTEDSRFRDRLPVTGLDWEQARALAGQLDALLGPEVRVRLPTEAEWEVACRAGSETPWHSGSAATSLAEVANIADRSSGLEWAADQVDDGWAELAPVASFQPNAWGLYDCHGNAWEWCRDAYREELPSEQQVDPLVTSGEGHVLRGGSWEEAPVQCRSANRRAASAGTNGRAFGVRLALELVDAGDDG